MTAFNMSWTDRAFNRGVGMEFFKPPEAECRFRHWHMIETHAGLRRMQWRPGIDVWHGEAGERWTAEAGHKNRWKYVGLADDQRGGLS